MSGILNHLPAPRHQFKSVIQTEEVRDTRIVSKKQGPPPYGHRKGFVPRSKEDFGDGGAFPEIHVAQYPLDMGKNKGSSETKTVALTLDNQGRIKYDAILNQNGDQNKIIHSRHEDVKEKRFGDDELRKPDPETEAEATERTRKALEQVTRGKIAAAQPKNVAKTNNDPTYIRYTPSSGGNQRIIRLTETQVDPLEPPNFKFKKAPRGPPSPPVPVMHSPPRKLSVQDQQDWKIPPCISNWKNNKGYTIALDKRLAADGRGLIETTINDNFAKLSESLYIAERVARDEVAKRAEIEKKLKVKEKEKREEVLRKLAQEARMERSTIEATEEGAEEEDSSRRERDEIREQRRRELERDLRMQRNKSAASRNQERDVSERVALGMAVPQQSSETMYDQRLFNQNQGMDSGFGEEDSYNIYSKPLFHASSANMLYRPKKASETENYGSEDDYKKLLDTSKFKPDKGFTGVDRSQGAQPRDGPLEFEKKEADPFGLDEFLSAAKKGGGKPNALDKIGSGGHMHASSGNAASNLSTDGGSVNSMTKRSRINFESSGNFGRDRDRKDDRSKKQR